MYVILEKSGYERIPFIVSVDWVFGDLDDVEDYIIDNRMTDKVIVASITPMYKMHGETHMTVKKEKL